MSRTKSNGITLKNLDDVDQALQKMCEIESRIEAIDNIANEEIAKIKERAAIDGKALREEKKSLVRSMEAYAVYFRDALFKERKSMDRPFGAFGFRKAPDSISVTKETADLLKQNGLDEYIRTKIEPDKEAMLSLPEETLSLVKAVKISKEDFFVETKRELVNQDLVRQGA